MKNPITLFRLTTGLNTVENASNLNLNTDNGVCELVTASNFDVSDSGSLVSRTGKEKILSGDVKELCSDNTFALAHIGTDLVFINSDLVCTTIATLNSNACYFAQLPGRIYFNNFSGQRGFVESGGVIEPWDFSSVVDGDNRELVGPPSGITHICYNLGSMYCALGKVLYYSEPFSPNVFSLATNYIDFGADILDLHSFKNVLYVLTTTGLYSHTGVGANMEQLCIAETNAIIAGTFADVLSFGESRQDGILAATKNGIAFITATGLTYVSSDKVNSLVGSKGSAYANNTHYYCAFS